MKQEKKTYKEQLADLGLTGEKETYPDVIINPDFKSMAHKEQLAELGFI